MKLTTFGKYDAGDFVPILVGVAIVCLSLPSFVMLLVDADPGAFGLVLPLLVLFGAGTLFGLAFATFGVRICSYPGSVAYKLTHGRIFSR